MMHLCIVLSTYWAPLIVSFHVGNGLLKRCPIYQVMCMCYLLDHRYKRTTITQTFDAPEMSTERIVCQVHALIKTYLKVFPKKYWTVCCWSVSVARYLWAIGIYTRSGNTGAGKVTHVVGRWSNLAQLLVRIACNNYRVIADSGDKENVIQVQTDECRLEVTSKLKIYHPGLK